MPPLVNGRNETKWENASAHGMGYHGREDGINKSETTSNREKAATRTRKARVIFREKGGKVGGFKLVCGKRKA